MSNKLKFKKPRETLRCCYLRQRGWYVFFFEKNGVSMSQIMHEPFFNFGGRRWEKTIERLCCEFKEYGITKEDVERVILEASKESHIKPPLYLR